MTTTEAVTDVVLIEVAVIVAVPVEPLALNVTEDVVALASVVQAVPEQLHVTPSPLSWAAVTVMVMLCP